MSDHDLIRGRNTTACLRATSPSRSVCQRALALVVAQTLLVSPALAQSETGTVAEAFAVNDRTTSLASAAVEGSTKPPTRSFSVPVSARGTYTTSIPIALPRGRGEMTPSLALAYDSGAAKADSVVGAGWSLEIGAPALVARSLRDGFPSLVRSADGGLRYAESGEEGARFEAAGEELVPLDAAAAHPPRVMQDSELFIPERAFGPPTVWEHGRARDSWVAHLPNGVKRTYGAMPPAGIGRVETARIKNELGTAAWYLLEERDVDGNAIGYDWFFTDDEDRPDLLSASRRPVLRSVAWGGHEGSGLRSPFRVAVTLDTAVDHGATDYKTGNVQTVGLVENIAVCGPVQALAGRSVGEEEALGPCAGGVAYRRLALEYAVSEDTGRRLLRGVRERVSDVAQERSWAFQHSSNGATIEFGAPEPLLLPGHDRELLDARLLIGPGAGEETEAQALFGSDVSVAARRLDVDGDGRADLLHHAAGIVAAGAPIVPDADVSMTPPGGPQPVSFLPFGPNLPRSAVTTPGGGDAIPLEVVPGETARLFELAAGQRRTGFLAPDFSYSDFADVDGDGRVDGVFFADVVTERPLPPRRGQACFSEAFWRACGPIDPPGPGFDLCEDTTLCDSLASTDTTACADGQCWVGVDQFAMLYSDLADWIQTPPLSDEGLRILDDNGYEADPSGTPLIRVDHASLRARLHIRVIFTDTEVKEIEAAAHAMSGNSLDRCQGIMEMCHGTGVFDGVPAPRIDVDFDGILTDLGLCRAQSHFTESLCRRSPRSHVTTLPALERVGIHVGGAVPAEVAPLVPLYGWPNGVAKVTRLIADNDGLGPFRAKIERDFTAPVTDINGDGVADVVLLRSTDTSEPGESALHEFTPRAFIASSDADIPLANAGAGVGFSLDWASFVASPQWPELHGFDPVSDFTQSLNDILVVPGYDWDLLALGPPAGDMVYPPGDAYDAFLLDLNSDGLPDLVAAEPDGGGAPSLVDLDNGHAVFANRGYRFGRPAEGPRDRPGVDGSWAPDLNPGPAVVAGGPLGRILKRELPEAGPSGVVTRDDKVPLPGTAFVDVNADGRTDVVIWANEPSVLDDPHTTLEVWLNRGNHFELVRDLDANGTDSIDIALPVGVEPSALHFAVLSPADALQPDAARRRGLLVGDLMRMEDADDDGLVDIVVPGVVCSSVLGPRGCDAEAGAALRPHLGGPADEWQTVSRGDAGFVYVKPASWMRNLGVHPDQLVTITTSAGLATEIEYENARTSPNVTSSFVPAGLQVATRVTTRTAPGGPPTTFELRYADFARGQRRLASPGFARVVAIITESFEGQPTSPATVTRVFDVGENAHGVIAPLRGLVRDEVVDADGLRTRTVTERTVRALQDERGRAAVRIEDDVVRSEECTGEASCTDTPLVSVTVIERRDRFGVPLEVRRGDAVCHGGPGVDCDAGFDFADNVITRREVEHLEGPWVLGLVTDETTEGIRFDVGGTAQDTTLSRELTEYDPLGRLRRKARPDIVEPVCLGAAGGERGAETVVLARDATGNVTDLRVNGQDIRVGYDPFSLYARAYDTTVGRTADGYPVSGTTTLITRVQTDVRSGMTWAVTDANGATTETRRDGDGRPLTGIDADGEVTVTFEWDDVFPIEHTETRFFGHGPLGGRGLAIVTTADGADNVRKRVEWTIDNGARVGAPRRAQAHDLDSAGRARRSYYPALTAADPGPTSVVSATRDFDGRG
ncbi:MAG: hypothetical protein HYS27_09745, partial [Deltaproteobacteria bacterium]|nr:hypothetical protein [Deltaproteobacteria bacterium]